MWSETWWILILGFMGHIRTFSYTWNEWAYQSESQRKTTDTDEDNSSRVFIKGLLTALWTGYRETTRNVWYLVAGKGRALLTSLSLKGQEKGTITEIQRQERTAFQELGGKG